jgi:uncharacterized membrane protein (DUF4010 family)
MELSTTFQQLGIALGLGLLVGLQRESQASPLAGVRTFPLITVFGTLCAMLAQVFGGWVLALGFVSLAGLICVGKLIESHQENAGHGLTTEIAMLLMFGVGAYLVLGNWVAAIAIGAGTAVLLQFKGQLHGIVQQLSEDDIKAIMQFALLSMVILPVLPNKTFGPYSVLNPRQIWLMVVLIVGINLSGYIVYKFFGVNAGVVLGGILGGVISSTATTVSYSRRTANAPTQSNLASLVIIIASSVVFFRLMIEIAFVSPAHWFSLAKPLVVMLCVMTVLSAGLWFWNRKVQNEMPEQENPSELKGAFFFGAIYAIVLFAVAAVKEKFGSQGLYVVASLSGLTDVDAITLSTSQLVNIGRLSVSDGSGLILVATMSNMVFKAAIIAVLGHKQLLMKILALYIAAMIVAVGLLLFS